jgi:hypothetical protein
MGRSWTRPTRVEEKTGEEKTRCDLVTRLKIWLQPVDFCFFLLKRRSFDFKKIEPGDLVTRLKPETRALDRTGSKNYDHYSFQQIFH